MPHAAWSTVARVVAFALAFVVMPDGPCPGRARVVA
jgi:hypothetical protein